MNTRLYVLHARSPLHVGTGQGVDLIDLPIARERASDHPLIPGSGVKGVLRDASRHAHGRDEDSDTWRAFGPNHRNAHAYASSLRFSDARLLLMPVQSDLGTFAWVTCPWVLTRLLRDAGDLLPKVGAELPTPGASQVLLSKDSVLKTSNAKPTLAGLDLTPGELAEAWSTWLAKLVFPGDATWSRMLQQRVAVVTDDLFTWLVQNRTDVRARIRIDEHTGTVDTGALWYEESLPTESVLVGVVQAVERKMAPDRCFEVLDGITKHPLQFGGKATTGMGVVKMHLVRGDA